MGRLKDILDIAGMIVVVAFAGFIILSVICTPYMWFQGNARSMYIYKAQGIKIPWYYAAWIDVNGINATLTHQKGD